jgi:hypothetical protein
MIHEMKPDVLIHCSHFRAARPQRLMISLFDFIVCNIRFLQPFFLHHESMLCRILKPSELLL